MLSITTRSSNPSDQTLLPSESKETKEKTTEKRLSASYNWGEWQEKIDARQANAALHSIIATAEAVINKKIAISGEQAYKVCVNLNKPISEI